MRRGEPAAARLRAEFDVPDDLCWVVLLDGRGETLDQFWSDTCTGACGRDIVGEFPELLVERIENGLEGAASAQELQRRWRLRPEDTDAFEAWIDRLEQMCAHRKARAECLRLLDEWWVPRNLAAIARIRALAARAHDLHGFTPDERRAFVREGEALLAEFADHPKVELARGVLLGATLHGFDVPAKCEAAFARLTALAGRAGKTDAMPAHLKAMAQTRDQWLAAIRKSRDPACAAALGDAETTIRVFSQPPFDARPECQEWVREAREKLHRERR